MVCNGRVGGHYSSNDKNVTRMQKFIKRVQNETPQQKAKRVAKELNDIGYNDHRRASNGELVSSPLNRDGLIEGCVWNDYVDKHFNSAKEAKQGKRHVKDDYKMPTADAIKLLNSYYTKGLDKDK